MGSEDEGDNGRTCGGEDAQGKGACRNLAKMPALVNGGFADVTPEGLTVLAEEAIDLADIAPAQLEQDLKNAQEDLRDANTDAKKDAAQRALSRLEIIKAAMAR